MFKSASLRTLLACSIALSSNAFAKSLSSSEHLNRELDRLKTKIKIAETKATTAEEIWLHSGEPVAGPLYNRFMGLRDEYERLLGEYNYEVDSQLEIALAEASTGDTRADFNSPELKPRIEMKPFSYKTLPKIEAYIFQQNGPCIDWTDEIATQIVKNADPDNFPNTRYLPAEHFPYGYAPNPKEFTDCSHFVHSIYQDVGLNFPYTSTSVFTSLEGKFFKEVDEEEVRKGDLALFAGHIGL